MINDVFEFMRIMLYPLGASGMISLAWRNYKTRSVYLATTGYFLMWAFLLTYLQIDPDGYRHLSNVISTPALLIFDVVIWGDVFLYRRRS